MLERLSFRNSCNSVDTIYQNLLSASIRFWEIEKQIARSSQQAKAYRMVCRALWAPDSALVCHGRRMRSGDAERVEGAEGGLGEGGIVPVWERPNTQSARRCFLSTSSIMHFGATSPTAAPQKHLKLLKARTRRNSLCSQSVARNTPLGFALFAMKTYMSRTLYVPLFILLLWLSAKYCEARVRCWWNRLPDFTSLALWHAAFASWIFYQSLQFLQR